MQKKDPFILNLIALSFLSIVFFSFTSLSLSSLHHIFLIIPTIYFIFNYRFISFDFKKDFSIVCIALFILWNLVSASFSPLEGLALKSILKTKYWLFAIVAVFSYRFYLSRRTINPKHIRILLNSFFIVLAIVNISGIYALFNGYHPLRLKAAADAERAAGMYGMAITYGYSIALACSLLTSFFINFRKKIPLYCSRNLFIFALFTSLAGLYFSYSRGALLGYLLSLPFCFFSNKKIMKISLASTLCILIAILTLIASNSFSSNRFFATFQHQSNLERISIYKTALIAFQERPILGWGYNNFQIVSPQIKAAHKIEYPDINSHAHNNFLETLADLGIPGFIFFSLFNLFWLLELIKGKSTVSYVFIPFFISFLISGLFQTTILDGETFFTILFVYALSKAPFSSFSLPRS
jgi:O-antigen ligase